MTVTLGATNSGYTIEPAIRRTLRRAVLRPEWALIAAVTVVFVIDPELSVVLRYGPLAASVVVFGLPHGAVDHLAVPRVRDDRPTLRAFAGVGVLYLLLGGAYTVVWFLAPTAAFVFFILLTWFHWGQGDLYAVAALGDADYLDTPATRWGTILVRGGLPMLVPLIGAPERYRAVAELLIALFTPEGAAALGWVFRPDVRLALGIGFATLAVLSLGVGYYRGGGATPAWRLDVGETVLLAGYFLVVPPVLAIGLYFCFWHSLRHIARLVLLDDRAVSTLRDRQVLPAVGRFIKDAAPLTAVSIGLLVGLALLVPNPRTDIQGFVGIYLVLIAVLTLPHVVIVSLMDEEQGLAAWPPVLTG
ncbi:MAG: Brp/Blh family beta-carotene 15,15'-dioxygenase [Halobacteriales archaeon]|nr:Brp/Blh family beta-carotene 15,15'-dioxygenase [Halobacteriales archaeon]